MSDARRVPLDFARVSAATVRRRARALRRRLSARRSVRAFSPEPVPRAVVEDLVAAAASAPSGANRQPWHFVAVSDPALKARIRSEVELREARLYAAMAPAFREALAPLGTGPDKPFLEEAPWLVALFARRNEVGPGGEARPNYYVAESVGMAAGFFVAAVHLAGLATVPTTPSRPAFLRELLGRPPEERPVFLFPLGRPAPACRVPALRRKPLPDVLTWLTPPPPDR